MAAGEREPDRELALEPLADRDFDRLLERDPALDPDPDPRPGEPSEEDDPIRLRLEVPLGPSASLSAPLAILSFSSSLSSEEDTMALDTIFFFCFADRPSSCPFLSAFFLAFSAFL